MIYESTFYEACAVGRKAARFVRHDMTVSLVKYRLLSLSTPLQVKPVDISSSGIQVCTTEKIKLNRELSVNLAFADGTQFALNSKIVRREDKTSYYYDLSFESATLADKCKDMRLKKVQLFDGDKLINTRFRDLTYDTVQIMTSAILDDYSALQIVFNFKNDEQLRAYAKILRTTKSINHYYGIKFNKRNDALGEHLVATQTDLLFSLCSLHGYIYQSYLTRCR